MGAVSIETPAWGLHVRLEGELSLDERDEMARQVEQACLALAGRGTPWSSLLELDGFQVDRFRPEVVVRLMRLGRDCGHARMALVMTDWTWACRFADAMIAAGTDDQVRIFVVPEITPEECGSAMDWVLHGGPLPLVSRAA